MDSIKLSEQEIEKLLLALFEKSEGLDTTAKQMARIILGEKNATK